jgi:protein-S-isoprenylcysteine O-methyltransferase Ste14
METFSKYFIGIVLLVFFASFMLKNIITTKRTKMAIKGKSMKVNLLILSSAVLYTTFYLYIFTSSSYFLGIEILEVFFLKIIGLALVIIAFVLGLTTLVTMRDSWRVGIRPEQKTGLVTNGIFRFSRNPYFLSYIILFLGVFLVFPNGVFFVFYFLMITIIHLMIRDEEKFLTEQHGQNYLDYKKKVNRYVTFV